MTRFEDRHSLWVYNYTADWLKRNQGIPDMKLCDGLNRYNACVAAQRLALVGVEITVKDIYGQAVSVPVVEKGKE